MKIDIKSAGAERLDPDYVKRFRSRTRAGVWHYTMWWKEDNTALCSCEGFQYNGVCWHVDEEPSSNGPVG